MRWEGQTLYSEYDEKVQIELAAELQEPDSGA